MGLFGGDDIEFVVSHLRDLKVEFHLKSAIKRAKRGGRPIGLISGLFLPFTEREWCHLCMREGAYYIGGCCGSSGYTQDAINAVFRDTGWAKADIFTEICEALTAHGDEPFQRPPKKFVTLTAFKELDPFERIAYLWHLTRKLLVIEPFEEKADRHDLKWHVQNAARSIRSLDYHFLVDGLFKKENPTAQDRASLTVSIAKTLPSLKALMERFHELAPAPFEGFAIVNKNSEPLANGLGPCIYDTREEAESALDRSKEYRKAYRPEDFPECRIVPVRVSLENGLQLL